MHAAPTHCMHAAVKGPARRGARAPAADMLRLPVQMSTLPKLALTRCAPRRRMSATSARNMRCMRPNSARWRPCGGHSEIWRVVLNRWCRVGGERREHALHEAQQRALEALWGCRGAQRRMHA